MFSFTCGLMAASGVVAFSEPGADPVGAGREIPTSSTVAGALQGSATNRRSPPPLSLQLGGAGGGRSPGVDAPVHVGRVRRSCEGADIPDRTGLGVAQVVGNPLGALAMGCWGKWKVIAAPARHDRLHSRGASRARAEAGLRVRHSRRLLHTTLRRFDLCGGGRSGAVARRGGRRHRSPRGVRLHRRSRRATMAVRLPP